MKVFVVGEDLTYANYQVSKKAMEHSATLAVWSSNGRILAKVKNGRKLRILDFFNFICICTDTVVVLNYALFVYLCGVCDSSVCFEIQDARILSLRLSTCDMPDMLCGMLAVLTGACSTKLLKPSVRTTCYFQGVFTTMAPICVVFVCIYMCVKTILPYYSVTAQFKLTLFLLFLLLLLLCLYLARSLKGFLCVGVCSLAAVKRSSV